MQSRISPFALALLLALGLNSAHSAIITWDGGGGDLNWNTALNWSGDAVPDGTSDVVISSLGTNSTITLGSSVLVRSLQCSASLNVSGGNLTLTNGASLVAGIFTMAPSRLLTVQGSNTTFVVNGSTAINDGDLMVSGGAVLTLPALNNYTKSCYGPSWTVTGSNSVLSLPALTNMAGPSCNNRTIQATAGGQLLATNLMTLALGAGTIMADGVGSLVDFRALRTVVAGNDFNNLLTFNAKNGGTVWIPQVVGGPWVSVILDNTGGILPIAQLQQLARITVSGGAVVSFPSLTNFVDGDLMVSGGAVLTLPTLNNYTKSCYGPSWTVTGSNSVLSLPALTNMAGPSCNNRTIQATAGGQLLATNLVTLALGAGTIMADGAGSLVDFRALRTATGGGTGGSLLTFNAKNGGVVRIPWCGVLTYVSIIAQSAGLIDMSLVQGISGRNCAITSTGTGSIVDLSSLSGFATPLGASSLTTSSGGVILLNTSVFLFVNVAVNISGNPVLPPVLSAGASVSLYGKAWHSYWVDWRDTRFPANPWQLYRRVPQTNDIQVIGGPPSSWQTFRVYEFIADPSLVDLNRENGGLLQPVLYGMTNKTFLMQSNTNLSNPANWQPGASVTMTNPFRIFSPIQPTNATYFLRAKEQ